MLTREQLHILIDALPDDALAATAAAIEQTTDPVLRALLLAPVDDEPLTAEDIVAIEEAKADPDQVPWVDYLSEPTGRLACPGK